MLSTNELKAIVDSRVITRDQSVEFVNNLEEFLNSEDFKERNFENFITEEEIPLIAKELKELKEYVMLTVISYGKNC